jgi:cytochrome c
MTSRIINLLFPDRGEKVVKGISAHPKVGQAQPPLTLTLSPQAGRGERVAFALILALAGLLAVSPAFAAGDPERGMQVYQGCQDCHSLDKNDVGPRHRGVFGRKAGSLPDFAYSPALKDAGFVWDEKTLDKWLTDPQAFLPGVRMFYHLANPTDRADVIAYLRERAK